MSTAPQSVLSASDDASKMTAGQQPNDRLKGLAIVLGAVLIYSVLHVGFRLLASPVLGEDDVVEVVFAQQFQIAYDFFPRQPPLYNWVLYGVQQFAGLGVEGFLLIKYAALTATAVLLYLASYRAFNDRLFAVLSVESLALIYQIAWRYHEGFTHEVLAMVMVMATVCVAFSIIHGPGLWKWVFLGVAMGLGLLTEPTYDVFVICLFIAVGLQPAARRVVFQRGLILSGLIALVVASPYLFWLLEDGRRLAAWWALFDLSAIGSIENTWAALRGPVAYLSPLIVILPLVFPGYLQTVWGDLRRGPERGPNADLEQISLHCGVLALAASLVGGLLLGVKGPAVHVLMPLYIPMVIWLFGVARRSSVTSLHVARFTQIALVIAVVAFGARMANMFVLDPVCKTCRWGIPYGALAQTLKEQGVSEAGTIVTVDKELAGNLRRYFPDAPIVNVMYPRFAPHGISAVKGDVTIIWPIGHKKLPVAAIASQITPVLPIGVGMKDATVLTVPWSHLWRDDGYRTSQWAFVRRLPSQPVGAADDGSRIQDTAQ